MQMQTGSLGAMWNTPSPWAESWVGSAVYFFIIRVPTITPSIKDYSGDGNKKQSRPRSVLYCASCVPDVLPGLCNVTNHSQYLWAVIVQSPQCNLGWIVCTLCSEAYAFI
jgi:hypothetical protein